MLLSRDGGEAKMPRTMPRLFVVCLADQADVGLLSLFSFWIAAKEEPCRTLEAASLALGGMEVAETCAIGYGCRYE